MKYGELTLGQVEAVVNKLGGMEGVKRLLSGETVIKESEHEFKIWKTIKLGTGLKTADDFRRALAKGRFRLGDWASDIIGKPAFTVAAEETEVDLVKVKVSELGFKNGARLDQIYERAKELGLVPCPAEVGPQLRLQYQDQPNDEWLLVAMEPILGSAATRRSSLWGATILHCGSAATGVLLTMSGVLAFGLSSSVSASNLRPSSWVLENLVPIGNLVSRPLANNPLSNCNAIR
jgi:hypothetical protein